MTHLPQLPQLDEEGFLAFIKKPLVFIDVWAGWCGPCRYLELSLKAFKKAHPDCPVGMLNIEREHELGRALGIQTVPTLLIYKGHARVYQHEGALSLDDLEGLYKEVLQLDVEHVLKDLGFQKE